MKRTTVIVSGLVCVAVAVGGCYKAEFETEKTRAVGLQKQLDEAESKLAKATADLQAALGRSATAEKNLADARALGTLAVIIDGKPAAQDSMRWDGTRWVRHGDCARPGGVVKFDGGRLIDQALFVQSVSGRPLVTGQVKGSRPDGEWMWFDGDGKPATKEVWRAGHLAEVHRANMASGVLAWDKLGRKDREAWARVSGNSLRDLPELLRDFTPPPAPPPPAAPPATDKPKAPVPAPKGAGRS